MTTAAEIAAALDGRRSGDGWEVRCPAHEDSTPSLSLTERDGRILVHCHARCEQSAVIAALRERGLWPATGTNGNDGRDVQPAPKGKPSITANSTAALRIWRQTHPAAGTVVETYLRSRGIELPTMPEMLHFHPALRHESGQRLPAMVAGVQDRTGAVVAIHRTYLRPDGSGKADVPKAKMMLGPVGGGAVRLSEAGEQPIIAEGIETALSVHIATGLPTWGALSAPGIAGLQLPALPLASDVIIATDADDDGASIEAARKAAARWQAEGRRVRVAPAPDGSDYNDVLRERGAARVSELIEAATEVEAMDTTTGADAAAAVPDMLERCKLTALSESAAPDATEAPLRALAELLRDADPLRRAVARSAAIELLKARKVNSPTALVDAALGTPAPSDATAGQGTALTLADPKPWPDPVDGAELLDEIANVFTRYVVLPACAADAVALWVLHTYLIVVLYVSPILALTSPQKRCGKSTLLDVLRALVRRAVGASNISAAALFRVIEKMTPTLLIDEADTFLADHDELRGILNAGHTRSTAQVIRTVGDDHDPRSFSTFCPKAIAAIGALPGTIEDRSIIVRMERRTPGEVIKRLRRDRIDAELEPLRCMAARWATDNTTVIRDADPEVSATLYNRAEDNWRPLLAIADAAGGNWPARARKAAPLLSGETVTEDADVKVQLLSDLRDIFTDRDADKLASETIVEALVKLETRPWAEWRHGKPLTAHGLARQLKSFGIHPKTVRVGADTAKGYDRADLLDAWNRYLPTVDGVFIRNSVTTLDRQGETALSHPSQRQDALRFENGRKPLGDKACDGVTDENGDLEEWVVS